MKSNDLLAEAYTTGTISSRVVAPTTFKAFKPWHKPRKQYIRDVQWNGAVSDLISILSKKDDRILNYMSLPGTDLLDIRNLHDVCTANRLPMRYLGFNSIQDEVQEETELKLSINEVSNLAFIHKQSTVIRDLFENIARGDSEASRYFKDFGPYDIVNLDLCKSLASPKRLQTPEVPSFYEALQTIFNVQLETRREPWLLLLTTRSGSDEVLESDIAGFWECIGENINLSREFGTEISKLAADDVSKFLKTPKKVFELEPVRFGKLFGVGIGKWILRTVLSGSPKSRVKMLKSYEYGVEKEGAFDMLSLAYIFEPVFQPVSNKGRLIRSGYKREPNLVNEAQMALEILKGVEDLSSLDEIMKDDSVYEKINSKNEQLLVQARYDVGRYRKWERKRQTVVARKKRGS